MRRKICIGTGAALGGFAAQGDSPDCVAWRHRLLAELDVAG